jgi:hypothetical protein
MNTENNRIIVDFMGIKPVYVFGKYSLAKDHIHVNCTTETETLNSFCKSTKYHSDWNWLMEVVEKIEILGYRVTIEEHFCRVELIILDDIVVSRRDIPKIQAVYTACLNFIKWYNEQSKN